MVRRPLFLDRDGVLNVDVTPYVTHVDQLQIFPYTVATLKKLHEAGFDLYVVSNQQGVAKGITTMEVVQACTDKIQEACRAAGFEIRKFYYCTALAGEDSSWRKPKPGMILATRDEFGLDLEGAFFIGDKWSDIEAGAKAGLRPLLVYTGVTAPSDSTAWAYPPEASFPTLVEAADYVLTTR